MFFIKIINNKKLTLISVFLFLYVMVNLLYGQRGLISYFEKKNVINLLNDEKITLSEKLNIIEKKNNMLTEVIDIDYLETLYRIKFMVGKKEEKIFVE